MRHRRRINGHFVPPPKASPAWSILMQRRSGGGGGGQEGREEVGGTTNSLFLLPHPTETVPISCGRSMCASVVRQKGPPKRGGGAAIFVTWKGRPPPTDHRPRVLQNGRRRRRRGGDRRHLTGSGDSRRYMYNTRRRRQGNKSRDIMTLLCNVTSPSSSFPPYRGDGFPPPSFLCMRIVLTPCTRPTNEKAPKHRNFNPFYFPSLSLKTREACTYY